MTARYLLGDRRFEIEVLRYAYPRTEEATAFDGALNLDFGHETTANWLDMRVLLADGQRSREIRGEIMLTYEVLALTEWLEDVAGGDYNVMPFSGMELNPELEVTRLPARGPVLRVTIGPWFMDDDDFMMDFDADPLVLRMFAIDLRREIGPFPVRPPRALEVIRSRTALFRTLHRKDLSWRRYAR